MVHLCLNILLEKHPELLMSLLFCLVMTSLLCLTWISLLTMWNVWLTNFRICGALLIHCSGMDIFFAMVCPVHICNGIAMLACHLASEIVN